MPVAEPSPTLASAFRQFVSRRGEDFSMRLLEAIDDRVPLERPQVLFRQLAMSSLWTHLRSLSELAM